MGVDAGVSAGVSAGASAGATASATASATARDAKCPLIGQFRLSPRSYLHQLSYETCGILYTRRSQRISLDQSLSLRC